MRNHLKISLWSLVLAATAVGVLGMHTQASAPDLGSTGSPVIAAKGHVTTVNADLTGMEPARSFVMSCRSGNPERSAQVDCTLVRQPSLRSLSVAEAATAMSPTEMMLNSNEPLPVERWDADEF